MDFVCRIHRVVGISEVGILHFPPPLMSNDIDAERSHAADLTYRSRRRDIDKYKQEQYQRAHRDCTRYPADSRPLAAGLLHIVRLESDRTSSRASERVEERADDCNVDDRRYDNQKPIQLRDRLRLRP